MRPKIVFLLISFLMIPVSGDAGPLAVFHIDARGKSGTEIGTELGKALKEKFPDIEKHIDGYLASLTRQHPFRTRYLRRIRAMKPNIEQRHRDEVDAVARCLASEQTDKLGDGRLSANELWLLQLITDVTTEVVCSGFGVFGNHAESGFPIVGRNMDWATDEGLRHLQAIVVYEYEERRFVNIGVAGYLPTVSGFNSHGLFAAHLHSPMGKLYPYPLTDEHSGVFDIRKALEEGASIPDAVKLLRHRCALSHNVLLADKRSVKVLEMASEAYGKVRTDTSRLRPDISWGKRNQIAVVNFFALYGNDNHPMEAVRWNRLKKLATFSPSHKARVTDLMRIMLDRGGDPFRKIFNDKTVHSMVFTPNDLKLHLYTVPISGVHDRNPVMKEVEIFPTDDNKTVLAKETPQKPGKKMNAQLAGLALVATMIAFGVTIFCHYRWPLPHRRKDRASSDYRGDFHE